MTVHIKLHGTKSDRFQSIKADLTALMGYEPTNPEALGWMMAEYDGATDA